MNKKTYGFTLTELLIVIIVIGILATIAVVSYRGIIARANDAVVASDLRSNLQRIHLFSIHNGRLPSSQDLASSSSGEDYKIKLSKRSVYAFYGYCSGSLGGEIEIIMTAGTSNGRQYYLSTKGGGMVDVSTDFNEASLFPVGSPTEYKCWDYLRPGSTLGEFRNMVHRSGGVEGGYVTIVNK